MAWSALLLLSVGIAAGSTVTISNVLPRRSLDGSIMDAHDGSIMYDEASKLYVWAAASYGNCKEPAGATGCSGAAPGSCGFMTTHNVSVFTSPDLSSWTAHAPVLQCAAAGLGDAILFCPKLVHNAATGKYVLWFNWIQGADFSASFYAVATADTYLGPFTVVVPKVTSLAYTNTGDFSLFVDEGGAGYIIYTAHITGYPVTHQMSVEALTDDFLGTRGAGASSGFIGASFVEAPALFRRGGVYYAVFGQCCCYCQAGSPVTVYTAPAALGPYTARGVLDPPPADVRTAAADASAGSRAAVKAPPPLSLADAPCSAHAQQSNIFAYTNGAGETQYGWYGDRWQSAPDGVKGHDFTYWSPLAFAADGNITAFAWVDNFTITVSHP